MNKNTIGNQIKIFLVQHFPATKNVGNDEPLLKNGLIDSLGILEVVTFMEKQFGIVVADEDLVPENFGSIDSLSQFVEHKSNGWANGKVVSTWTSND